MRLPARFAAGSALSVAAGRLSYMYGFKGPSVAVDTACSSSLVGAHMARISMAQGGCSTATAAGVKLILTPITSAMFNRAGMLTADGRCKTLDAAADGYVRGEAIVSLVLQRLSTAAAAGSSSAALCFLAGTAVNQDGRSSTLTAPNGPAQQAAVRQALASAGLAAAALGVVQLHGTGTPLGDPIEVGALAAVLAAGRGRQVVLAAGKTSMGHTEPAAGLVGLAHASQALAAALVQPILHLHKVSNTMASLDPSVQLWPCAVLWCLLPSAQPSRPLQILCSLLLLSCLQLSTYMEGSVGGTNHGLFSMSRQLAGLASSAAAEQAGVAGISSFAFQGTNAHALISPACHSASAAAAAPAGPVMPAWQRQYVSVVPPAHTQLFAATVAAGVGAARQVTFDMRLGSQAVHAFFCDHQVSGKLIFPGKQALLFATPCFLDSWKRYSAFEQALQLHGKLQPACPLPSMPLAAGAGYLEMAAAVGQAMLIPGGAASSAGMCLVGTTISAPLILSSPAAAPADYLAAALRAQVAVADGSCQLASGSTVHVSTRFAPAAASVGAAAGLAAVAATEQLAAACSEPLATEYAYRRLAAAGLQYGPSFRLLRGIKRSGSAAAAKVQQPAAQLPAEYILNPAVLDCCLQLGGMVPNQPSQQQAASGASQGTFIPAALAALYVGAAISSSSNGNGPATALAMRPAGVHDSEAAVLRNHMIVGAAGGIVCQLERLESRATSGRGRSAATAASAATAELARQDMLYEISWAAADYSATAAPLAAGASGSSSMLSLAGAGRGSEQLAAASIAAVQGALVSSAAGLRLQTRSQHIVHALPAGAVSSEAACQLWGLLRTAAAECQTLAVTGADGDTLAPGSLAAAASAQLLVGSSQASEAFDGYGSAAAGGSRFLPLMQPSAARSSPAPFQLFPQPRGALQNLAPLLLVVSSVAPGQVLVAVKAVGINFRDVLNVLGMYPGDPGAPGGDCAGIVIAVGSPVTGSVPSLAVGQPVFGLAAGSLGSHVLASGQTLVPLPASLSFEAAASMPTVFVTVDAALHQSAAMQPGERVLVHAAAGGVGLAAVQVIQAAGATAVATAGSPAKRSLLHSLGVQHVLGSRDTSFVSEAAQLGGADIVLNSLTSSGMVAGSLAALGVGGRFVEISKRDIWSAARIAQGKWLAASGSCCRGCNAISRLHLSRSPLTVYTCMELLLPACPQSALMWPTLWWLLTSCRSMPCTLRCPAWLAAWRRAPCVRCP
jgi:NADPH:quinone reductase-like Zn-dependent oxidoreductase